MLILTLTLTCGNTVINVYLINYTMSSHPDEESNSLSTNISTISPFDISTDIATIDTIEQPSLKNRKYGRMFTFYYKDNNPVFAVGPDCNYI